MRTAGTDHITANLSSSSFSFLFPVKAEWAQHDRSEYADGTTGQTQRKRVRAARLLHVDLLRRTKQLRPDPARLLRARQLRDTRLSEASRAKVSYEDAITAFRM